MTMSGVTLHDMLHLARRERASDLHFAPGAAPSIRVDGSLRFIDSTSVTSDRTREIASILAGPERVAQAESGADISVAWADRDGAPTRAHVYRSNNGLTVALRLLQVDVPTLESLHLPPVVLSMTQRTRGLVLFAGPTGSGKSTSLAAAIDRINATQKRVIVTIEDPIEYRHSNKLSLVLQREIGRDAASFESALQGALRADPDVIMVGELRNSETMRAALNASETGHLVLATLHTGDAPQTIDRIIDSFAGSEQAQIRIQLSQVLAGVVCQRLLPRAQGAGRRVAAEILVVTDAVRNLIRDGRTFQIRNAMLTGRAAGMQTLEHHLAELLSRGEVDRAAAAGAG